MATAAVNAPRIAANIRGESAQPAAVEMTIAENAAARGADTATNQVYAAATALALRGQLTIVKELDGQGQDFPAK